MFFLPHPAHIFGYKPTGTLLTPVTSSSTELPLSPAITPQIFHFRAKKKFKVAILDYRALRPGADPGSWQSAAGEVSHKPGGRLPLLSARPTVTPANLKRAAANFAAW